MELMEDQLEFSINLFKYIPYLIYSICAFINGSQIYSQILYSYTLINNYMMYLPPSTVLSNSIIYLYIVKTVDQNSYLNIHYIKKAFV